MWGWITGPTNHKSRIQWSNTAHKTYVVLSDLIPNLQDQIIHETGHWIFFGPI